MRRVVVIAAGMLVLACATKPVQVLGSADDRIRILQIRLDGKEQVVTESSSPGTFYLEGGYLGLRQYAYEVTFNDGPKACVKPALNPWAMLIPLGFISGPLGWTSNVRLEPSVLSQKDAHGPCEKY